MKRFLASLLVFVAAFAAPAPAHALLLDFWAWDYTMYAFCDLCDGCACNDGLGNPYDFPRQGDPISEPDGNLNGDPDEPLGPEGDD